jgi:predicted RNase H-like HicB family nuclease
MKFIVTFTPDEDGGFVAECPALPGCVSHGETVDEAAANIREAIELSLETRKANGLPLYVEVREIEVAA